MQVGPEQSKTICAGKAKKTSWETLNAKCWALEVTFWEEKGKTPISTSGAKLGSVEQEATALWFPDLVIRWSDPPALSSSLALGCQMVARFSDQASLRLKVNFRFPLPSVENRMSASSRAMLN